MSSEWSINGAPQHVSVDGGPSFVPSELLQSLSIQRDEWQEQLIAVIDSLADDLEQSGSGGSASRATLTALPRYRPA
jgi:hypothetical protein